MQMTVIRGWVAGQWYDKITDLSKLEEPLRSMLIQGRGACIAAVLLAHAFFRDGTGFKRLLNELRMVCGSLPFQAWW